MLIWLIISVIYVMCLVTLGLTTLRKGHSVLFWAGIVFPLLWIVGAFLQPTPAASADLARASLQ
jgi:hypothetical protein